MKKISLLLLFFIPLSIFAQKCDCTSVFKWAKNTFEQNDAGFHYILEKKTHKQMKYTVNYYKKVNNANTAVECETAIRECMILKPIQEWICSLN